MTEALPRRRKSKPLSIVAMKIVQQAVRQDVELATLSKLAESDPGFAVRVVSAVNGAAYGLPRKVNDVRQACSMLGVRGVRNLALSLAVSDMIPTGADGSLLLANSLRRAVAARLLAEALSERQTDEYFTVGLFLEIGLLHTESGSLAGSAEIARMPAAYRQIYERACGRQEHAVAGAAMAAKLMLPEALTEAVSTHHAPVPPTSKLGRVAWAAERLAGAFEGGDPARTRRDALEAAAAVGVDVAAATHLLERIPGLVAEGAESFDRDVPEQPKLDALIVDAHRSLVDLNVCYDRMVRRLETLLVEKDQLTASLEQANQALANAAATDALTGLPNRRSFDEAIRRDLSRAERTKDRLSIMMLDVDHFKKVNDTYGHLVGDIVLRNVGDVLRRSLRTGDIPARFGGEEFVAILPGSDGEGGRIVAERVRLALAAVPMPGAREPFGVTASFGVATCVGAAGHDAEKAILARADAALYEAKRGGRNRVVVAP